MRKKHWKSIMLLLMCVMLTACGNTEIEDYATNEGYTAAAGNVASQAQQENGEDNAGSGESEETGIPVEILRSICGLWVRILQRHPQKLVCWMRTLP